MVSQFSLEGRRVNETFDITHNQNGFITSYDFNTVLYDSDDRIIKAGNHPGYAYDNQGRINKTSDIDITYNTQNLIVKLSNQVFSANYEYGPTTFDWTEATSFAGFPERTGLTPVVFDEKLWV